MAELPNWVYDLVMDLQEQERTHPKLMFTSGGSDGYQQWDWCACMALEKVPADVLGHAAVLAEYLRGVTVHQLPPSRDGVSPSTGDNEDVDPSRIAGSKVVHGE